MTAVINYFNDHVESPQALDFFKMEKFLAGNTPLQAHDFDQKRS